MNAKYFRRATLLLLGAAILSSTAATAEASEAAAKSPAFELPQSIGAGENKEVSVLLDERYLKLATVILRDDTALPAPSTPVPATVQVLEGEGVIHVGSKAVPVSKGTIVLLAAGEEHDVVPAPGSDMLLLVHYLRHSAGVAAVPPAGENH
jgi:quercetin dioxygenase-like cupin family protein